MKRKGEKKKKKRARRKKGGKEKKAKVVFAEKKKLFDERGLFSSNVLNNSATSIHLSKFVK